jgi:methylated-DNA-[protein]-cysteine S-methyltransferase
MTTPTGDHLERELRGLPAPATQARAQLRARLATRAEEEALLDVAYAPVDSPLGTLVVATTPTGVVRLAFADEPRDTVLADLARRLSPRVLEAPARLDPARRELDEYFGGKRTRFDLALDWALTTGFRRDVLTATSRIPYGETATYTSVATAAGNPRAVRAAGSALATNPIPIIVPCHRVVRSDGTLGGYRGGLPLKDELLRLEASGTTGGAG